MSVISKEPIDMNYKIDNPERVIDELIEYDFTQEETKNLDLMEFFTSNLARITQSSDLNCYRYLANLIRQLYNSNDFKFINKYMDKKKHLKNFVEALLGYWPDILAEAIRNLYSNQQEENKITEENMRKLSVLSLCCDNASYDKIKCNTHIEYISTHKNYIHDNDEDIGRVVNKLKEFNIKFEDITHFDSRFLSEVYKFGMYKINYENIKALFVSNYGVCNESELKHMNYTKIKELDEDYLIKYIEDDNINEYMDSMLENCDGKITDDEIAALDILNSDKLTEDRKNKYIENLNGNVISEIKAVTDMSLWDQLLKGGCIKDNYNNIHDYYYGKFELTDVLVDYINKSHNVMCISNANYESESKFIEDLIHKNEINDNKYKEILEICNYTITDFYQSDYDNIDKNKIYILIETGTLQISKDNSWVCEYLIESKELKRDAKIPILLKYIYVQDKDPISRMLDTLSLSEYKKIFDKKTRPRFVVNKESKLILDAFEQRGFIANYATDERKPRCYKIYRTRPR